MHGIEDAQILLKLWASEKNHLCIQDIYLYMNRLFLVQRLQKYIILYIQEQESKGKIWTN